MFTESPEFISISQQMATFLSDVGELALSNEDFVVSITSGEECVQISLPRNPISVCESLYKRMKNFNVPDSEHKAFVDSLLKLFENSLYTKAVEYTVAFVIKQLSLSSYEDTVEKISELFIRSKKLRPYYTSIVKLCLKIDVSNGFDISSFFGHEVLDASHEEEVTVESSKEEAESVESLSEDKDESSKEDSFPIITEGEIKVHII